MASKILLLIIGTILIVQNIFGFEPFTVQNYIFAEEKGKFLSLATDWNGCLENCLQDKKCTSYNYWYNDLNIKDPLNGLCELNVCGSTLTQQCPGENRLYFQRGTVYHQIRASKENCHESLLKEPESCADWLKTNKTSGLYTIILSPSHSVQVYCDQITDGGGWTVIQRRINGSVSFYRNWTEYKHGFGDKKKEFWLGLDNIHLLTKKPSKIRIELKDCNMTTAYAQYTSFQVGGETDKYKMLLGGYEKGDAGDSFTFQNNMSFTTFDRDNDVLGNKNCAVMFKGAWWYKDCHYSNLNGEYKCGLHKTFADGMTWETWRGFYYSVRETEMKIRPL